MSNFSKWELAEITAFVENNPELLEDDPLLDAKLEIQREVEDNKSNVLVEGIKTRRASFFAKLWAYIKIIV